MKKSILMTAFAVPFLLLNLNGFSQCPEKQFNLTKDDHIIKELMGDFGVDVDCPFTIYLKYRTPDDDLIVLNYIDDFEFSDDDNLLYYEDDEVQLTQHYLNVLSCNREIITNGKKETLYTRTYILIDLDTEIGNTNVMAEEVYVTSKDPDFEELSTVTVKHELGYTQSIVMTWNSYKVIKN